LIPWTAPTFLLATLKHLNILIRFLLLDLQLIKLYFLFEVINNCFLKFKPQAYKAQVSFWEAGKVSTTLLIDHYQRGLGSGGSQDDDLTISKLNFELLSNKQTEGLL
jgi:hypothetical protein